MICAVTDSKYKGSDFREVGFNCVEDFSAKELSVLGTVCHLQLWRLRLSTFSRSGWMIGVKIWIFKALASHLLHLQISTSYYKLQAR